MEKKEIQAYVVRIYPAVTRKTKDGSDFTSQKVLIEFDRQDEYPSRLVLEQGGDRKIEVVKKLEEGKEYLFKLNFRANERQDASGNQTAFGSISAWAAEEIQEAATDVLPF